jgi:putative ABC transport system permease protein
MTWLALRTVVRRPTGSVAMFVSFVAGATVVIAALLLIEAPLRAQPASDGGEGIDALVIGEEPAGSEVTLDEDLPAPLARAIGRIESALAPSFALADRASLVDGTLTGTLQDLDGVVGAAPVVRVSVSVAGADGDAVVARSGPPAGRNWGSVDVEEARLLEGDAPQAVGEVALDDALASAAGVRPGDDVRIAATGPAETYRVVGTVEWTGRDDVTTTPTVWFDDAHAGALRGAPAGSVDAIALRFAARADHSALLAEVRRVAGDHDVLVGRRLAELEDPAWAETRRWLPVIGASFLGIAILAVTVVTANVLGVALQRRQREVALLRTIGATPRQARRLVGQEAVVVAVAAGLVAAPLAHLLADRLIRGLTDVGALPTSLPVPVTPWSALVGIALVATMARVGAAVAARGPTKGAPAVAAFDAAGASALPGRARTATGIGFAALGSAGVVVPPFVVGPLFAAASAATASLFLIAAAGMLAPWVVFGVARAGARRSSTRPGSVRFLAFSSLRSRTAQAGAICTTVIVAGAFAAVGIGAQFQQAATAEHQLVDGTRSDHLVVGDAGALPKSVVDDLGAQPAIASVSGVATRPVRHVFQEFGFGGAEAATQETVRALWVDPATVGDAIDLGISGGDIRSLTSDGVVVGREHATMAGLTIGDTTTVTLADGTTHELQVIALHDNELAFGELVVSQDLTDDPAARSFVDAVHLTAAQGVSAEDVSAAITTLRGRYPGLQMRTEEDALRDVRTRHQPELWANVLLLSTLCGLAYLAVLNTLVTGALDRSREFALLRVAGAHVRQMVRQARFEAAMLGSVTLAISTAIAGTTLVALQMAFTGSVVPQVPAGMLVALFGLPLVALMSATEVATRVALRGSAVETIGTER